MQRSTYWIALLLLGFFLLKVLRFQTLGYTFNDMYAFLQMSRSWMDGRPFMYENVWGYHHNIHNYYTVLLWGPLSRAFGAYGFFAVQAGLLLISYALVNERLTRKFVHAGLRYILLVVILGGPVSFWLNDHPNIGWHTELTYLPFSLLFALALLSRKKRLVIGSGLLVVLVKEDGAVLAATIHLSYAGMQFVRQQPARPLWQWLRQRHFWQIALGWTAVFLAGMLWLSYKNDVAEPRLQMALTLLVTNIDKGAFWRQMLLVIGQSGLLLLPAAGVLWFVLNRLNNNRGVTGAVFGLWGVGVGVLTLLNFVQSVHYYTQPLFYLVSLTWPPRFVLIWGFSAAFLTLLLDLWARDSRPFQSSAAWLAGAVLFLAQVPIVYLARPDFPSPREWAYTLRGRYASNKNSIYLQPADLAVVRCVAAQLPHDTNVFAFDFLVPFFHRQYGIWPTGKHYRPADVALIPLEDIQQLRRKLPMRAPFRIIRLKGYDLYVTAAYEKTVKPCVP